MKWIDFLFWHYYCYFEQVKKKKKGHGDSTWMAIVIIAFTVLFAIGVTIGEINTFIIELNTPKYGTPEGRIFSGAVCIIFLALMCWRYYKQKSIVKNNYELFRKRWGDPENVSKKNMRILLIYTIIGTIGMYLYAAIMGELNKRGMLEGYRLFP